MALRAGVPVADVEFMQFHPTALHHPAMPRPLLSEALRGHGALLRDADGERFVDELAPRDVVSRAMAERMQPAGRGEPVAGRHRPRLVRCAVPDHRRLAAGHRPRPRPRLAADRPCRPLPVRRGDHRSVGGHRPARAVGGRRGGVHRCTRGQPAGLQLAAGGHGLRGPTGRVDPGRCGSGLAHRGDARLSAGRCRIGRPGAGGTVVGPVGPDGDGDRGGSTAPAGPMSPRPGTSSSG